MFEQGDIVSIKFPFTDFSKSKKRPALIISSEKVNKTGDYLLVQITSKVKKDGLSLSIEENDYGAKILPLQSYIRIHKIFLLNESLIIRKVSSVNDGFINTVVESIIELFK